MDPKRISEIHSSNGNELIERLGDLGLDTTGAEKDLRERLIRHEETLYISTSQPRKSGIADLSQSEYQEIVLSPVNEGGTT